MNSEHVGRTCPYCQAVIKPGDDVVVCPRCGVAHHKECWEASGGCTTIGCARTIDAADRGTGGSARVLAGSTSAASSSPSRANRRDTACLHCGKNIPRSARICPSCHLPVRSGLMVVRHYNLRNATNVLLAAVIGVSILGYLLGYAPGWLYDSVEDWTRELTPWWRYDAEVNLLFLVGPMGLLALLRGIVPFRYWHCGSCNRLLKRKKWRRPRDCKYCGVALDR